MSHPARLTAPAGGHRRLFDSLDREVADVPLRVRGRLPAWLGGSLVRNGPARFDMGRQAVRHWLDGHAMLHRFAFRDGGVRYTNRFLATRALEASTRTGRLGYREFATDPCSTLFGRLRTLFDPAVSDNASVSVGMLGEQAVALAEGALPVAFDLRTLRATGAIGYADRPALRSELTTAHPHEETDRDDEDGATASIRPPRAATLVNHFTRLGMRSHYEVFRVHPGARAREVLARIPVRRPAYVHSIGLTRRWVLLAEFPFTVDPATLLLSGRPFIENYRWCPGHGVRVLLVDRCGGRAPIACRGDALFAFHHVNAFDDGDDVVMDVVGYDDPAIIDALYLDRLRADAPAFPVGTFRRLRLVLPRGGAREGTVHEVARGDDAIEMPRIDTARRNARPYRWCWATAAARPGGFLDGLVKLDVHDGTTRHWREDGCVAGEPVFVPRPGGRAEDDGVLLSVLLDARRDRSALLVLDARTLGELARAEAPHVIPAGFHGAHFAD